MLPSADAWCGSPQRRSLGLRHACGALCCAVSARKRTLAALGKGLRHTCTQGGFARGRRRGCMAEGSGQSAWTDSGHSSEMMFPGRLRDGCCQLLVGAGGCRDHHAVVVQTGALGCQAEPCEAPGVSRWLQVRTQFWCTASRDARRQPEHQRRPPQLAAASAVVSAYPGEPALCHRTGGSQPACVEPALHVVTSCNAGARAVSAGKPQRNVSSQSVSLQASVARTDL